MKKKTKRTTTSKQSAGKKVLQKKSGAETTPVRQALQITWVLKGKLKSSQIYFLKIGALLAQVREEKLFAVLKHPDMEDYAWKRLQLRQASMYRYIQVYDWVKEFHPAWILPKPKGFIPDLNDVTDLMWIENKLMETNLSKQTRTELEVMRKSALNGTLRGTELDAWKRRGARSGDGVRSFLSSVRSLRKRGASLDKIPREAIEHLDAAITIINGVKASPQEK